MSSALARLVESARFQWFITAVIVLAGVLVGAETYAGFAARHETVLHVLDRGVIAIFVLEVVARMGAHGARPWRYFLDPWNVFDFTIVVGALLPFGSGAIAVLRLLRLLRVVRLVRALPRLRILVNALLASVPSMAYVTTLLALLFYVYAVAAVTLFGANDPIHFASLHLAMLSLFRVVTLEDWTDIMYINMYGCDGYGYGGNEALCTSPAAAPVLAALFFVSFVLLGTMIVLNLFVGVILSGIQDATMDAHDERVALLAGSEELHTELQDVERRLTELTQALVALQRRLPRTTLTAPPGAQGPAGEA